jgi:uncharacterized protein (TIGR02231 family)
VSAAWLTEMLAAVGTGGGEARARIREASTRQRELDREIEALEAELRKVMTNRRSTAHVLATVETDSPVDVPVNIQYAVDDAGWMWAYEARLDSTTRRLAIERKAIAGQATGEDWRNVRLVLSTARARHDVANSTIGSAFVDIARPLAQFATERPSADRSRAAVEEIVVTGSLIRARATAFLAEYDIPGRVTIAADGEPQLFAIDTREFDVALVTRAIMFADGVPRLEAVFTYEDEVPLQEGEVQLYRDGAYIGAWDAPTLRPGEDVRLPFGVDDRVRIAVHQEPEQSRERGMLNRQQIDEHRQRFEITSHHATPLTIELVDRVPVTRNAAIKVATLAGSTPPSDAKLEGMDGVYLWRLDGAPRETSTVRHYYAIEYPAGERILMSR